MATQKTVAQALGAALFIASVGVTILNHFTVTTTQLIEITVLVAASFVCFGFAYRKRVETQ